MLTESPAATSTVFTVPAIGNANSTFFTGTTVPDAVALLEDDDGCEAELSDTVGMTTGVADWPQAVTVITKTLNNIQRTFFIFMISGRLL